MAQTNRLNQKVIPKMDKENLRKLIQKIHHLPCYNTICIHFNKCKRNCDKERLKKLKDNTEKLISYTEIHPILEQINELINT